jgi:hypothetical protein
VFELNILWIIDSGFNPGKTLMWSIGIGLTVYVVVIVSVCMDVLMAHRERNIQKRQLNSVPTTQRWHYLPIFFTLGAIVGGYFGFYYIGRSSAENTDTFYVVKQSAGGKEDSEVVFLGNYGDYLVGIPFHRDIKKFESFVIWKMPQADTTRLTFTYEKVGPLQRATGKSAEVKP